MFQIKQTKEYEAKDKIRQDARWPEHQLQFFSDLSKSENVLGMHLSNPQARRIAAIELLGSIGWTPTK